ncbi:hypothetical protein ACHQM5_023530 [Ranunculus cassubicifolius]
MFVYFRSINNNKLRSVSPLIGLKSPRVFKPSFLVIRVTIVSLFHRYLLAQLFNVPKWSRVSLSCRSTLFRLSKQMKLDAPDYAPGTQKKVTGEVIRWNHVSGAERIDAVKYIELLEAEIEELNCQVGRKAANGSNQLLEYLKTLEPQNLKELTSSAGEDAVLAMNTFIKRLLAVSDPAQMKTAATETSAPELAKLLYWLMVVGYGIRNIEVRFDMERMLGTTPKLAENTEHINMGPILQGPTWQHNLAFV